jgi:exopolysaccharide biosynthesis polyprenyl glycosylphosphotransferase
MPRIRILLLLLGDLLFLLVSYLLIALFLRKERYPDDPVDAEFYLFEEYGLIQVCLAALTVIVGVYFIGLYERIRVRSRRQLSEDLMLVFGVAFLIQALVSYTRSNYVLSRYAMLFGSLISFVALVAWRSVYSIMLTRVVGRQRVLFLGDTPLSRTIARDIMEHPEKGFDVIGCVSDQPNTEDFPGGKIMPLTAELHETILQMAPDRVSVSGLLNTNDALAQQLLWCSSQGLNVENLGDLYENLFQRVALETVTLNQLVFSPAFRVPSWMVVCQEFYGRAVALIGLLLTWPFMILTAIAVRLDSDGPALLKQRRVGKNGKVFEILKFRSMYIDADARFGRSRASAGDPRITRVGRFIRVSRLDELPQFINVLRGDMTLVGPRPEMPIYVEEICRELPVYMQRHRVKPGITGWAQLHHEPEYSTKDTERKIAYDLYYIKHMSPLLDFLIMFHTIKTVIFRIGAR